MRKSNILGVGISALSEQRAVEQIINCIEKSKRCYISICTVHTVMECQFCPAVRNAVNHAALATPDGMPLVWITRWKLKNEAVGRVYGPDLMLALCRASIPNGFSHYFYGGAAGVAENLAIRLQRRYPGLKVAGTGAPPFRPTTTQERQSAIQHINDSMADIVWVGLGTPKQDLWMAQNRDYLTPSVLIGVGAAFDFHTGRVAQAPQWMQKSGLEWLFRLNKEPRRLWRRYLIYNPLFITMILMQHLILRILINLPK